MAWFPCCFAVPMLEATSAVQVAQERIISDAFTELFTTAQGKTPSRPPPLWKTCCMITFPLFIINWLLVANFTPILTQFNHVNSYGITFIIPTLTVIINTYIGTPLMQVQFGHWLLLPRPFSPINYLDVGFPKPMQILMCAIYFGFLIGFGFS